MAEDGTESITLWFNNKGWHTLPILLNTLHNAALKTTATENSSRSISSECQ